MKKLIFLWLLGLGMLSGCQNELYKDAAEDYKAKQGVFITSNSIVQTFIEEGQAKHIEEVQLGLVNKPDAPVNVSLQIENQSVLDAYNKKNGTDYILLPSEMYNIPMSVTFDTKETRVILPVELKDNVAFSGEGTYALPLRIKAGDVNIIPGEDDVLLVFEPILYKKVFKLQSSGEDIEDTEMFADDFKVDQWTMEAMVMHTHYISNNVSICGTRLATETTMDEIYPRFGDVTIKPYQFQLKTASTQIDVPEEKFKAEANQWYMISLVYNGKKNYIYINGELVADETLRTGAYGLTGFWLGGANEWIREVRFWKIARTQDQIKSSLWKSVNPDDDNLLLYYPLDGRKRDIDSGEITEDETKIWDWSKSGKHLNMPSRGIFDKNDGDGFRFPPMSVTD